MDNIFKVRNLHKKHNSSGKLRNYQIFYKKIDMIVKIFFFQYTILLIFLFIIFLSTNKNYFFKTFFAFEILIHFTSHHLKFYGNLY